MPLPVPRGTDEVEQAENDKAEIGALSFRKGGEREGRGERDWGERRGEELCHALHHLLRGSG